MDRLKPSIALIVSSSDHTSMQTHSKAFAALTCSELGYEIVEVNPDRRFITRDAASFDPLDELKKRSANNAVTMIVVSSTNQGNIPTDTLNETEVIRNIVGAQVPILALHADHPSIPTQMGNNTYFTNATSITAFEQARELKASFLSTADLSQPGKERDTSGYWNDVQRLRGMTEDDRKELLLSLEEVHNRKDYVQHCFGLAVDARSLTVEWISGYGMHYVAVEKLEEVLTVMEEVQQRQQASNKPLQRTDREIFWGLLWKIPQVSTPLYQLFLEPDSSSFHTEENVRRVAKRLLEEGKCIPMTGDMRLIDGNFSYYSTQP